MAARNLKPETIAKLEAKRKADIERLNNIVLDALVRLGGTFQGRVMQFRKYLAEPLREAQIKDALKRLAADYRIKIEGERNSAKGIAYTVAQ